MTQNEIGPNEHCGNAVTEAVMFIVAFAGLLRCVASIANILKPDRNVFDESFTHEGK